MNDDTFARVVAEDVKNRATQPQKEYLKLPENWDRWQRSLATLETNLNDQLASIHNSERKQIDTYQALGTDGAKLIVEATIEQEARRKKIERFKFHVTSKIDEVTRLIVTGGEIEQHYSMMVSCDFEPTPIDSALWAALEGHWEFDNLVKEEMATFS